MALAGRSDVSGASLSGNIGKCPREYGDARSATLNLFAAETTARKWCLVQARCEIITPIFFFKIPGSARSTEEVR